MIRFDMNYQVLLFGCNIILGGCCYWRTVLMKKMPIISAGTQLSGIKMDELETSEHLF